MARSFQVTIDANDTFALAEFWAAALGYVVQPPPEGSDTWEAFADEMNIPPQERDRYAAVIDPSGDGPRVLIQKVPEPKTAKNRVHLDLHISDHTAPAHERRLAIDAAAGELIALGATRGDDFEEFGAVWTVMHDPEGNEFCLT